MKETRAVMIKRLRMRSMRRGIKEMDLILTDFSTRHLDAMSPAELALYDRLLHENDHDIFAWILGKTDVPHHYDALMAQIVTGAAGVVGVDRV